MSRIGHRTRLTCSLYSFLLKYPVYLRSTHRINIWWPVSSAVLCQNVQLWENCTTIYYLFTEAPCCFQNEADEASPRQTGMELNMVGITGRIPWTQNLAKFTALAQRMIISKTLQISAMKRGLELEPRAAEVYAENRNVNVYII